MAGGEIMAPKAPMNVTVALDFAREQAAIDAIAAFYVPCRVVLYLRSPQ
jgi:hypothetical protein